MCIDGYFLLGILDTPPLACRESIVSDKWITEELEAIDVGSYLGLPRNLLPEVFFESGLPVWEELHPRGGCRGLEVPSSLDVPIFDYSKAFFLDCMT